VQERDVSLRQVERGSVRDAWRHQPGQTPRAQQLRLRKEGARDAAEAARQLKTTRLALALVALLAVILFVRLAFGGGAAPTAPPQGSPQDAIMPEGGAAGGTAAAPVSPSLPVVAVQPTVPAAAGGPSGVLVAPQPTLLGWGQPPAPAQSMQPVDDTPAAVWSAGQEAGSAQAWAPAEETQEQMYGDGTESAQWTGEDGALLSSDPPAPVFPLPGSQVSAPDATQWGLAPSQGIAPAFGGVGGQAAMPAFGTGSMQPD
jgi:hypothetical protein